MQEKGCTEEMGMNPETHRFEELVDDSALKSAYAKGWKVFKIGEKVTFKETDFTVVDISPTKLILRPYGITQLTGNIQSSDPSGAVGVGPIMPRYRSHKEVSALKIAHVEHLRTDTTTDENPIVKIHFVDSGFAPIEMNLRGKPTPDVGWYYVVYGDGYQSFSPEKAFEEGNTLI